MSDFAQRAQQAITAQLQQTTQLLELLKQEFEMLKDRKADKLEELSVQKQAVVDTLEQLNQDWQTTLRTENIKIGIAEITQALESADPAASLGLVQSWQSLSEQAKACHRQNQINGTVLVLRHQATQQTIDLLRGQQDDATYDPQGKRKPGGEGHTIAKA